LTKPVNSYICHCSEFYKEIIIHSYNYPETKRRVKFSMGSHKKSERKREIERRRHRRKKRLKQRAKEEAAKK